LWTDRIVPKSYTYNFIFVATYVVASKCARKHFSFEKYKTFQSLKLHSFKIVPVQLYISASDSKDFGNISGSYLLKNISDLPSHP